MSSPSRHPHSGPSILKIKKEEVFLRTGAFKIIHIINLGNFATTLSDIKSIVKTFDKNNEFSNILENRIQNLEKLFKNLKPKNRRKRSWEGLGSAIKWMTGNADADDLREIDSKFSKIDDFNEDLKQRNNEQADINRIFEDSINDLTKTISNSISLKFNQTFNSLDIINLMFNIQIIENKLEKLSEAIIISKLKLAAKGILNESELELIESKLKEQNLKFTSNVAFCTSRN